MFQKTYESMIRQARPGEELILTTAEAMERAAAPVKPNGKKVKRPFALALACVLAVALSLTAVAAAFPSFRELLFGPQSQLANSLTPIVEGYEADGIRMEVLGAMAEEDSFSAYFTLQDLEKKDRLSGGMSVIARVRLNGRFPTRENELPEGTDYFTHTLDYNEETQTALCRLDMTTAYGPLENARVKLSVIKLMRSTGGNDYIPLELPEELFSEETLPVYGVFSFGVSTNPSLKPQGVLTLEEAGYDEIPNGRDSFQYNRDENGMPVFFKPGDGFVIPDIEFSRVTAAGFLDGKLHIQIWQPAWSEYGPYEDYNLYCADRGQGQEVAERLASRKPGLTNLASYDLLSYKYLGGRGFILDEQDRVICGPGDGTPYYLEQVFDIGPEELDQYEIFAISNTGITQKTDLAVEFSLMGSLPRGMASFGPLQAGEVSVETLEITPMGIYLTGTRGGIGGIESLELVCGDKAVSYRLSDTSRSYYSHSWESWEEDDYASAKYLTDGAAVDPERVTALRVNGVEIPLE